MAPANVFPSSLKLTILLLFVGCVDCQGRNVRLIPGPDRGRLEVSVKGIWGVVCNREFTNIAASVVCRTLNQPSNNSYSMEGHEFRRGSLNPILSGVYCAGNETSLDNCTLTPSSSTSCSSTSYVVGIVCTNDNVPALFKYNGKWFDSPRLNVFNKDYIVCSAGNNTRAKNFQCSVKLGDVDVTSGSCTRGQSLPDLYQGNITCSVWSWQRRGWNSVTVEINTMYPPKRFETSEIKVFEGATANVSLTNIPNPLPYRTTWRKTGTRQMWKQTEVYRMYKNISRADRGEFLVNISSQLNSSAKVSKEGSGWELVFVDVQYPPTLKCREKYVVHEGSTVNVTCKVDASPLPHVYVWFDKHGNIFRQGFEPTLVIASVGVEDTGRYKCTAMNRMQDNKGRMESGIGLAEIEIILAGDQPSVLGSQLAGTSTSPSTEPPISGFGSGSAPLPTVTYVMIGIAVASLIAALVMTVVIVQLKKDKGVLDISHVRDIHKDQSVRYNRESHYLSLDCMNDNKK